ncbi:MAG: GntR family transcriptional regulator [Eubacteriaceae bacterium]|jgi:DNA-binding GntR family transcriptional regulator|nr:GntR family transcriptional regulator [Eubacteriaceae bacterium]
MEKGKKLAILLSENPFKSLVDAIYEILIDEIVKFNYRPGEKIIEYKIAEEFGVSRSPVHSAIEMLIDQGFVIKTGNKSLAIAPFDYKDYRELMFFRSLIEPVAAGLACKRMTTDDFEILTKYGNALDSTSKAKDYESAYEYENIFHGFIIKCSQNRYLINSYSAIESSIKQSRAYITATEGIYPFFCQEHYLIVNCMKLRDEVLSEAIMRRHLSLLVPFHENNEQTDIDYESILKRQRELIDDMLRK